MVSVYPSMTEGVVRSRTVKAYSTVSGLPEMYELASAAGKQFQLNVAR